MSLKNFLLVRLLEKLGNVGGRTPIAIDKSVYEVRNDVVLCKTGKSFVSITKKNKSMSPAKSSASFHSNNLIIKLM